MKKLITFLIGTLLINSFANAQAINEGFANVAGLTAAGWNQQNLSTPIGTNPNWVQGSSTVFPEYSAPVDSYVASNYNAVAGAATISNWLITPTLNLSNGDVISFYTRSTGSIYPDNLQIRMSTNGSSTNVGATNTSVGDFSNLLLEINPALTAAGYPSTWTQYTITISGLAAPTQGRFAFRYYVPNGGPSGLNSDYIGIDDFVYTPAPTCNLLATATAYNAYGGGANGTISASATNGTSPYTYTWSNGQTTPTVNNLTPGQYTVTITDAAGCTASASATVINLAGPTVLSNSNVVSSYQTVNGGFTPQWVCPNDTLHSDGGIMRIYLESGATMITGGGIDSIFAKTGSTIIMTGGIHKIFHEPGVNLILNGGIPTVHLCPSLVFNYSQAPANGCVTPPTCNLSANAVSSSVSCYGESSGSVDLTIAGAALPVSYAWSNGAVTEDLNGLPAGNYSVTVTDANGCTANQQVLITEPSPLLASITILDSILCAGESALVEVSASGGTPGYFGTGTFIAGPGSQSYSITDANGCLATSIITITQPLPITLTGSSTDEMMGMDGTASVVAAGGTAPYTYSWSPSGGNGATATGLSAGTYTVTVTDANGCSANQQVTVNSQVGVDPLADEMGLTLYPNPVSTELTITNFTTLSGVVQITTIEGKLMCNLVISSGAAQTLDVSGWANGTYVLISQGAVCQQKTFIKQ